MKLLKKIVIWMAVGIGLISAVYAQDKAAYGMAIDEFQGLSLSAQKNGDMPRISDQRVADLIFTLSDNRLLDSVTYEPKDLGRLLSICGQSTAMIFSYVAFDLKRNIAPLTDQALIAQEMQTRMQENSLRFQDELAQLVPFSVRCQARLMPLLEKFWLRLKLEERTDVRRAGLTQVQNGVLNIYIGGLRTSMDPGMKASFQVKMLTVLSENAATFSPMLTPVIRAIISDFAKSVQTNTPESSHRFLKNIVDAMHIARCDDFCQF